MTNEDLEKLRADLADLDARRAHDHDDPVKKAHPLMAMFDETTVRKLLDALNEAEMRAKVAEVRWLAQPRGHLTAERDAEIRLACGGIFITTNADGDVLEVLV